MSRATQLRAALDRCRDRVGYCRRELERFCGGTDLVNEKAQRTHRKLLTELDRAKNDCSWLQQQLDQALHVDGLDL